MQQQGFEEPAAAAAPAGARVQLVRESAGDDADDGQRRHHAQDVRRRSSRRDASGRVELGAAHDERGVASIAERLCGACLLSWEDLVRRYVVRPLGLTTFGFGWPVDALGHGEDLEPVLYQSPNQAWDEDDNGIDATGDGGQTGGCDPPWHTAAYAVHSSLADWVTPAHFAPRTARPSS